MPTLLDPTSVDKAYANFQNGLSELTYKKGPKHASKACLICDKLLEWNDTGIIPVARLKQMKSRFQGEWEVFRNSTSSGVLKSYYTYRGYGRERWMKEMFLSPRGYYRRDEQGFQCCEACVKTLNTNIRPARLKLPRFSIANGALYGEAPPELTDLNDAELALVSRARTNKHVFAFYGGAHKSMRGWHNLYENDVDGIARTLNQVTHYSGDNVILCILLGPFTPLQKEFVKNKMLVRPTAVLRALHWLKEFNPLYEDVTIPNESDLATPLIIDDSEDVESQDTNIESRMEYTIVFPETDGITQTNGGFMTQEDFRKEVIDAMDTTSETTIISRPTRSRLIDYKGDALMRAFPLQFPYGVGLPPEAGLTTRTDSKNVALSKLAYLQHLQHLSIRHFHRGDFILVLHNMYERQRAASVAYLRAKNTMGDDSFAEHVAGMGVSQLQNAINRKHAGLDVPDRVTREFLKSIDAVCKSMGHTNDAAKSARLKMLADTVRFGTGAVFLTVTPDDNNCLRIKIYVEHESDNPPDTFTASDEEVKADFDVSVQLRQDYPGFCAFDFQQITELMIEHILGWDRNKKNSYPNGGAFGLLDAWNIAVEEQGRKTLHSHWILYVREWSSLLLGLYSKDLHMRSRAETELRTYVETIVCTKLFGLDKNIAQKGYKHECVVRKPPTPEICSDQDLRNLRFKHGESSLKDDKILICGKCERTFSPQDLVDNVISDWFGNTSVLKCRLRLAVKHHSGPSKATESMKESVLAEFMTHALTNLHASRHVSTCFKKGSECRSKLPQRPCMCTRVHFFEDEPMKWWTWMGDKEEREPFVIESERHVFDVFMNQYHAQLSNILGCNTNVQCGIGGGHLMYVTYYASKSTQVEDRYAYCRVAKTLYKRIRRTEEDAAAGIDVDNNPFQEGYRRLLSAVLSHTESTVVSGPMAWFIMKNQSRFLFSHDHAYGAFDSLLGRTTPTRIANIGANTFVLNRVHDYIYRPEELENVNWYDFVALYDVKHISKATEDSILRFSSEEHPLSKFRGVVERPEMATPLVSYLDFPNAADFEGNLMDPVVTPTPLMEKFAKAALCLFVPFRDEEEFRNDNMQQRSYVHELRHAVNSNAISGQCLVRLQNIQDCHNMMKAGRQRDLLERVTVPLPDPDRNSRCDHDDDTQKELENHIDMFLTELVADMDEDNALQQPDAPMSLDEFRKAGTDNCGYSGISANVVDENSCVFQMNVPPGHFRNSGGNVSDNSEDDDDPTNNLPSNPRRTETDEVMTRARLTALSINVVRRHVEHIDAVSHTNPNGTAKSIQEWAKIMFTDTESGERDYAQQRAFEVIVSMFVLTFHDEATANEGRNDVGTQTPPHRATYNALKKQLKKMSGMKKQKQLILFMTGAGGSGKTRVLNAVLAYAKGFCKELNYMFDKRMIVVTALTGVAATLINGETTHSAAKLNCKQIKTDHIEEWKHARLVIIDEISFASSADLIKLNDKMQALKETIGQKYGNLHIIFTGDFSQLEPVSGRPLYQETNFPIWHDWVNCFIELTGQHRFKFDRSYGGIMRRLHGGHPTIDDIALLNSRVLNGNHPDAPTTSDLPADMAYAVYRNADKSAINNGIFAEHIRKTHSTNPTVPPPLHTVVIRSDQLTWKYNKKPFGPTAKASMWSGCSDSHIKTGGEHGKYVDAFLKLTTNTPLMYTENSDVTNGIANGTLCNLVKIVLHDGVTEGDFNIMNIDGYYVRTIDATKVNYLLCKITGSNRTFEVRADHVACKIDLPIELLPGERSRKIVRATINRFPVLINHATTGHKLQGQTKSSLCISDWHYGSNWPYVVLSRVTSLKGLFLLKPIRLDHDFSHDGRLTRMLTRMREKTPEPYDPDSF